MKKLTWTTAVIAIMVLTAFLYPSASEGQLEYAFLTKWKTQKIFTTRNGYSMPPTDIAVSNVSLPKGQQGAAAANVYMANRNHNRIQKYSSDGVFQTEWEVKSSGGSELRGITVDEIIAGEYIYAATSRHGIQKFASDGTLVTKWVIYQGEWGTPEWEQHRKRLAWAKDVAVGPFGYVYVLMGTHGYRYDESLNGTCVQKYTSDGDFVLEWFEKGIYGKSIAVGNACYLLDTGYVAYVLKFSLDGTPLTKWGPWGEEDGQFIDPCGIAVTTSIDQGDTVYVADTGNNRIQKFTSTGHFLTKWGVDREVNGYYMIGHNMTFYSPEGVAVDSSLNVYVADTEHLRIMKFKRHTSPRTVYVSTTGDDYTGNGFWSKPYRTIQKGIDEAFDGDTVEVADGIYTGTVTRDYQDIDDRFEWLGIVTIGSNVNLDFSGKAITVKSVNGAEKTIIDCENIEGQRGFYFHTGETSNSVLDGFTIRNGTGVRYGNGGGIYCDDNSSPTITNNIITRNSSGGIYCDDNSSPMITNNIITRNSGGGISCETNSSPMITNNTITRNSGGGIHSGGIFCEYNASPTITNTILWYNSPQEISFGTLGGRPRKPNTVTISYSDVQGGEAGIVTNNNGTVIWLDGNIDAAPLFVDAANGDYHLSESSPCLGAGTSNGASVTDIEGINRKMPPSIGAYEGSSGPPQSHLTVQALSPVDLVVTDPQGRTISKDASTIPSASYTETDLNDDGDPDDKIIILEPLAGDYSIEVVPEPGADPTDTYTLNVSRGGESTTLAENLQIQDIPVEPYSFSVEPAGEPTGEPTDVNDDGVVNILDLVLVGKHFGEDYQTTSKPYPPWDVNDDGVVDILDLTLVVKHFGEN